MESQTSNEIADQEVQGLVSIVIPAYRSDKYIGKTLDAIGRQTYANWEVLVVEDGSTGATRAIVEEFAKNFPRNRIRYDRNDRNLGPTATRNRGVSNARGSYIAYVDADDFWAPEHLDVNVAALESSGKDIAYSAMLLFDDQTNQVLGVVGPDPNELATFPRSLFARGYVCVSTIVMRRKVAAAVGPWNETLSHGDDYEYWLRCVVTDQKFQYVNGSTSYYRKNHGGNLTQSECALFETQAHIKAKFIGRPPFDDKSLRRYQAKAYAQAAAGHFRANAEDPSADPRRAPALWVRAWATQPKRVGCLFRAAWAVLDNVSGGAYRRFARKFFAARATPTPHAMRSTMPLNGASVVVCCHNSAHRIVPTIEHLARLKVSHPWEVVLVDNNSTDETAALAEKTWRDLGAPAPLQIVTERRTGLSLARDRGVAAAKYELIVFCDDDNWLADAYLDRAMEVMAARSEVGVLGGQGLPIADVPLPGWYWLCYESFAIGAQALHSGDLTDRGYVYGAGMALRRSVYLRLLASGARHLLTDRVGTKLSSGGDNEICMWHILAGYRLWYDELLTFQHYMPETRLTKAYWVQLRGDCQGHEDVLDTYRLVAKAMRCRRVLKQMLKFVSGATRAAWGSKRGRRIAEAYSPFQRIMFDEQTGQIRQFAQRIKRGELGDVVSGKLTVENLNKVPQAHVGMNDVAPQLHAA